MEVSCNNEKEDAQQAIECRRMSQKWRIRIKKYLELENVSVLVGAGGSFHLGAPIIRKIKDCKGLKTSFSEKYFGSEANPSYEDLFNCLQADIFLLTQKGESTAEQEKAICWKK